MEGKKRKDAKPRDPVRRRLLRLLKAKGSTMITASLAMGRNAAYLQQFIHRGIPKILAEDDREILTEHLGCRPELLKHGQGHRRSTHARRPPPSDAYAAPQGYSVVLEADVRVEAGVEATGTATCVRRAGGGCSPTRSSATGSRPIPAIFVIWDGIALVPKRIEHVPHSEPSRVILKSLNPEYGGHECAAEEVRIVGAGAKRARPAMVACVENASCLAPGQCRRHRREQ